MSDDIMYALQITYIDSKNDCFLTVGGAGWKDQQSWDEEFKKVPATHEDTDFILDKVDPNGDFVDEKMITAKTAGELLGMSLSEMLEKAEEERQQIINEGHTP